MKNWTWQMFVGKFLFFAVALVELLGKELGLKIPWAAIIIPGVTGLGQLILGFVPAEGWPRAIGKVLMWGIGVVELALTQLGLRVPIWAILMPFLTALAQYALSYVPPIKATA
jgi:hypothetical protein